MCIFVVLGYVHFGDDPFYVVLKLSPKTLFLSNLASRTPEICLTTQVFVTKK